MMPRAFRLADAVLEIEPNIIVDHDMVEVVLFVSALDSLMLEED